MPVVMNHAGGDAPCRGCVMPVVMHHAGGCVMPLVMRHFGCMTHHSRDVVH